MCVGGRSGGRGVRGRVWGRCFVGVGLIDVGGACAPRVVVRSAALMS